MSSACQPGERGQQERKGRGVGRRERRWRRDWIESRERVKRVKGEIAWRGGGEVGQLLCCR